jgi:BolA protein
MTTRAHRIHAAIAQAFAPAQVDLRDDSAKHAGHAGVRTGPGHAEGVGETHYTLRVVSPAFAGMNRVARSRAVHEALADEFASGLHALSLKLLTPEEA